MPTPERTIKITFLGGPETGKSTLVQALLGDRITYLNTDEISVSQHAIEIDDEKLTLQYRDFARYLSPQVAAITKTYLSTTHLFIGCFDLTRAENSLTRLKIMLLTQCHLAPNATIIIVGTGADLTGQYSKRNVKSLFSAFMADLNTSTLKNRIVDNTYLPVSDSIKPSIENLKKTIVTQIKRLPKPTQIIGDTTMPAASTIETNEASEIKKPGYFTRLKNFFNRHPYVRNGLIAAAIIVGLAALATSLWVFAAGFAALAGATAAWITAASVFGTGIGFGFATGGLMLVGAVLSGSGIASALLVFASHKKTAALSKTASAEMKLTQGQANINDALASTPPSSSHRPWATKESTPAPQKPRSNSNKSLTELMDDMGMRAQGASPLYKVNDEANDTTTTPSPTTT